MKKILSLLMCVMLLCALLPAGAEEISVTAKVAEIEQYGHAQLDITIEDFNNAGFELGDIITVKAGNYEGDMPYFNGYYVDRGEYLVCAYPRHDYISVCINYGKFAETAGVGVGDPVTLTLKEKGGALTLQDISNLEYSDNREEFESDEVFANFRAVLPGKLYRSASPIDEVSKRASFADPLIQAAGIKTVMNMANSEEQMAEFLAAETFASPYYKSLFDAGKVILLAMPTNFDSDEFADGLIKGLTFLSENEPPYLVHCTEGKDRAGFASMILEMLCGFSTEEILADYMLSYINYYGIRPGTEKYDMIAEKNAIEMMRTIAGLEKGADLSAVDWKAAAEKYLTDHGMSADALATLEEKLK